MTDFTPDSPIEQALLDASQGGDPDPLLRRLAIDDLFVPAQPEDGAPEGELPPGAEVALPVFEHEGARYVPVYTSARRLAEAAPSAARYLRATGADLAAIWPAGHHLALNPGGAVSVAVAEPDVRALAGEERIPAGTELTVGAPADEPEDLWDRLRGWAASVPEIRAAHRALVLVHGEDERPRLVVALDLDPDADPGRILHAGAEQLDGEAAFTLLDPAGEDPLSGWILAQGRPLYVRAPA